MIAQKMPIYDNLKHVNMKRVIDTLYAERHLHDFVKQAWPYIETCQYIDGWHIQAICEHLEAVANGEIKRLLINIPPRCSKSTLTSICFPAWTWLNHPGMKFLTGSHSKELAIRDTRKTRQLIMTDWYQERWGDRFSLISDQNQKSFYENDQNGYRIAFSTYSSFTGHGGDIILFDDPIDVRDAWSKTKRDFVNRTISESLYMRLNDKRKSAMIGIMQRSHVDDPTGYLMKMQPDGWELLMLPLEFEPHRRCKTSIFIDPRKEEGESICEERFDRKVIDELKLVLGGSAVAQLQQRPVADGGNIINTDAFGRYKEMPKFDYIAQGWDTAFKTGERNDNSVCITVGTTKNAFYIIDCWCKKVDYPTLKQAAITNADCWHPNIILIEDKASGQSLVQDLKDTTKLPIKEISVVRDKEVRAHETTDLVETGKIHVPEKAYWLNDFIDELAAFPKGRHDDRVDAFTLIINYLKSKRRHARPRFMYI